MLTVHTYLTCVDKTYALRCKPLTSVNFAMQSMNHSDKGSYRRQHCHHCGVTHYVWVSISGAVQCFEALAEQRLKEERQKRAMEKRRRPRSNVPLPLHAKLLLQKCPLHFGSRPKICNSCYAQFIIAKQNGPYCPQHNGTMPWSCVRCRAHLNTIKCYSIREKYL